MRNGGAANVASFFFAKLKMKILYFITEECV